MERKRTLKEEFDQLYNDFVKKKRPDSKLFYKNKLFAKNKIRNRIKSPVKEELQKACFTPNTKECGSLSTEVLVRRKKKRKSKIQRTLMAQKDHLRDVIDRLHLVAGLPYLHGQGYMSNVHKNVSRAFVFLQRSIAAIKAKEKVASTTDNEEWKSEVNTESAALSNRERDTSKSHISIDAASTVTTQNNIGVRICKPYSANRDPSLRQGLKSSRASTGMKVCDIKLLVVKEAVDSMATKKPNIAIKDSLEIRPVDVNQCGSTRYQTAPRTGSLPSWKQSKVKVTEKYIPMAKKIDFLPLFSTKFSQTGGVWKSIVEEN